VGGGTKLLEGVIKYLGGGGLSFRQLNTFGAYRLVATILAL